MAGPPWRDYQDEAAKFFRSLGLEARVDATIEGARGRHAVDVLVSLRRAGSVQFWVVECKWWRRPVGKDRVLTLVGVVDDVGADRGVMLSESGFQAGAIRAAKNSSITLTSLRDLRENASEERAQVAAQAALVRVVALLDRVARLRSRGTDPTQRMLPGVQTEVTVPVVGRLTLVRNGLTRASANLVPTIVDLTIEGREIAAQSLEEAAAIASGVADWAESQILEQERRATAWNATEP
jgi:hypothetical protein